MPMKAALSFLTWQTCSPIASPSRKEKTTHLPIVQLDTQHENIESLDYGA